MADTVAITAGTGTTIGTDEVTIGGTLQHVQRVKLVDGTDGGTALISGDANGLNVHVLSQGGSVVDVVSNSVDGRSENLIGLIVASLSYDYDGAGSWQRKRRGANTATLSNVASSISSVILKALNTDRLGLSIHNDSTAILYVKFGTTASATSFTVKMAADAYYEAPFGFTGRVDGIWDTATGSARVTEFT